MKYNRLDKKDRLFLLGMLFFCIICSLYYFAGIMSEYNTSLYVLSYKYGFMSRGLIGTIWQWLDALLPFNLMNYYSIYNMNMLFTAVLYMFYFVMYYIMLRIVPQSEKSNIKYLIIFLSIFTFPMFVTRQNMGRIDIFLIMITILCVCLIICEKLEWLIIPLCIIAMLIHQGFVFTNVNIILALLLYKFFDSKYRKKYIVIFVLTLLSISALFLYFELYSHNLGQEVYDEVVKKAEGISYNGKYYEMLFKHEILGLDVHEDESFWHLQNKIELPIFLVLIVPYLLLVFMFLKNIFKNCGKKNIFIYLVVVCGSLTLLPEWILKVDYGRYVYATVFYYFVIVMALVCMKDRVITDALNSIKGVLSKSKFSALLIVYPILFMPLYDTEISNLTYQILRFIGFRE